MSRGIALVTGGTDTHLILADLTPKGVGGKPAAIALEHAGIVCNYNSVPFDKRKPFAPSGIRLGTPAITSRGMGVDEMKTIGGWVADVIENVDDEKVLARVKASGGSSAITSPRPGS